ncbi:MAG: hypothetical protein V1885_00965 [Candidatus Brennerbacteria bacterium]
MSHMKVPLSILRAALTVFLVFGAATTAHAFIGPGTQSPGSGGGLFYVDPNRNIGFGTSSSTPVSTFNPTSTESGPSNFGYVFTVASTSNPGIAVKKTSATGFGYVQYIWSVRDFGNLQLYREASNLPGFAIFDINPYGDVAIGQKATSTGVGVPARLFVGGSIKAAENVIASSSFIGNAANLTGVSPLSISGGFFQNAVYAFPGPGGGAASLAVGTSTIANLPQVLSVYGGGYFSGSVGIGTTTPATTLQIVSSGNNGVAIGTTGYPSWMGNNGLYVDGAFRAGTYLVASGGSVTWGASTAYIVGYSSGSSMNLRFYTSSTERVRIAESGNVGIGTTTPASRLTVIGSSTITDDIYLTDSKSLRLDSAAATTLLIGNYNSGSFTYGTGAGTASLAVEGDVKGNRLCFGDADCQTSWSGIVGAGGGNYWIQSGSNLYPSSTSWNVGIGTTTPSAQLHLYSTNVPEIRLQDDSSADYSYLTTNTGQDFVLAVTGSNPIRFYTNGNERVRFDENGNVGIGTSTPSQKLTIVGNIEINNTIAGVPQIRFFESDSAYTESMRLLRNNDKLSLTYGHNANEEALTITNTGNVGIGTTTPSKKLHVESGGANSAIFSDPITIGYTFASTDAARKDYVDNNFAPIGGASGVWQLSGSNLYASSTSWNVGIGTSTPVAALNVLSSSNDISRLAGTAVTGGYQSFYDNASGTTRGYVGYGSTLFTAQPITTFGIRSQGALALGRSGSAISMLIDTSGNVGIGTTTPAKKLHVESGGANSAIFSDPITIGYPASSTDAARKDYVDLAIGAVSSSTATAYATSSGACDIDATCEMNGANLQGGDILGVDKLTVTTIDPLYQIGAVKYATYAASIAGGVKEEYVGSATLARFNKKADAYEYTIDFDAINDGSSLWVWRKTVEFGKDTVQVLMTPYGQSANLYYLIQDNKLVLRGDKPAEFSFRLIGNRFDWRDWPTLAKDQTERAGLYIK